MAPKAKGKGKAGPPPQQPKTLSSRVRQVVEQQKAAEEDAAEQQEELVVPIQMAFTSLISTSWSLKRSSAFCMINNYCNAAPLWRDSFFVSLESSWLEPPLHKYVRPQDADLPEERLMVQLWRESRFRERLQLGYKLLYEHNDAAGAAMLLFDIAPSHFSKDWVTRIQLACAAYKQAWRSRSSDNMEARQLREGGMALEDVRWLRAQWLLARVLCAALGQTNRRTSGLLSMVTSALVGLAPEDPMGGRFLVQRSLVGNSDWDNLDEATAPVSAPCERFENLPHNVFGLDTYTMATAYNRALACYHCYGPEGSYTLAAVKAALDLDPARWVPLLLAGGALAVPGRPPLVALGSKEEASAYCMEFGNVWWLGILSQEGLDAVLSGEEDMEQPEPVTWLLEQAGLDDLAGTAANVSHLGVVNFNLGLVNNCMACCLSVVVDEMNVRLNSVSMSVGTSESSKPESCPSVARSCLAFMCCLGSASQNLPPVDTCDTQLWAPAARMWGLSTRELAPAGIKTRVSDTASAVFDIAQRLIAQCRVWWQQAQRGELQGGLSLLWASELQHWERTMEELRPARARMFWQAGQVRTAKDVAAELLEQQEQLHAKLQSQLSTIKSPAARDAALAKLLHGKPTAPGPVLHSLAAIRDLQEFLNQQAVEAARRTLSSRTRGGARGGSSSKVGSLEAPAVQYQRYEEATAEALKRFTTAVLDAVGGQASINAALDVGQLLQAYGRNGSSSSQQDSESEGDEDDDAFGGKSRAEVGISVIEQLLTSQTPLTSPGAAAAGPGGRRVPAARQQQLHQAAGISTGSTSSSGSRTEPSIVAALRATLRSEETPDWLTGMSAGLSHSAGCSCCCPHMDFVREALQDPAVIKAALTDIMRSRGVEPGQVPGAQAAINHLAGQLPKLMVQDTGEGPGSSSGSDGSRPLGQRQVRQRTAEPGGESGLSGIPDSTAAEAVATFQAAIGAAAPAGAGQGGDGSAQQGTAAKATQAALLEFAFREGKGPFGAEDPGPGFVFGSNPEAAAAAASAAFDSVLKSYAAPAQQSAAGGASSKPEAAAAAASAAFDSGLQSYTAPALGAGGGPEAAVTEEEEEEVFVQSYKGPAQQSAAGGAGSVAQRAPPAAAAGSSGTSAGLGASTAAAAAAAAAATGAAAVGGSKRCACCCGSFAKLYRCSNCAAAGLEVSYCSAACQKSHWKAGHKKVCGKVHQ